MKTDTRSNHKRLARSASGRFLPKFHTVKIPTDSIATCIAAGFKSRRDADAMAQRFSRIGDTTRIGISVTPSEIFTGEYSIWAEGTTETENELFRELNAAIRWPSAY